MDFPRPFNDEPYVVLFNLGEPVVDVTLFLRPFGRLAWIGTGHGLLLYTADCSPDFRGIKKYLLEILTPLVKCNGTVSYTALFHCILQKELKSPRGTFGFPKSYW